MNYYLVLPSFTEFYRVLQSFTEFREVLPSFMKYCRVSWSITKFYRVLSSASKFHRVLSRFTEFCRVFNRNRAKTHRDTLIKKNPIKRLENAIAARWSKLDPLGVASLFFGPLLFWFSKKKYVVMMIPFRFPFCDQRKREQSTAVAYRLSNRLSATAHHLSAPPLRLDRIRPSSQQKVDGFSLDFITFLWLFL